VNTLIARLLAGAALFVPGRLAGAAPEPLYVAVGGWGHVAGTAREGDPARIAAALGSGWRVRVVDLTAADAKVRAVRDDQLSRAISLRPALVSISVGPLDVLAGTSLAAFSRDLWHSLAGQFGAAYGRIRAFKSSFVEALRIVLVVYPAGNATPTDRGLQLTPGRPHVAHVASRRAGVGSGALSI
jgi:hypothetical protein